MKIYRLYESEDYDEGDTTHGYFSSMEKAQLVLDQMSELAKKNGAPLWGLEIEEINLDEYEIPGYLFRKREPAKLTPMDQIVLDSTFILMEKMLTASNPLLDKLKDEK